MVKEIAIYLEGGGDTSSTQAPFRKGMSTFLGSVIQRARERRVFWRVIVCGPRHLAYKAFVDAIENEPDVFNVLLVDAEDPIPIAQSPWTHLENRPEDQWKKPRIANDELCQLMVACMEAWFIADPHGMRVHFGKNFSVDALPAAAQAESRNKKQVLNAIKKATRETAAKEYRKIRDGAKLLGTVNPEVVQENCAWCRRLFATLESALGFKA